MNAELRVKVRHAKCCVETPLHFLFHLKEQMLCIAKRLSQQVITKTIIRKVTWRKPPRSEENT
jgi:hypothetical protein